MRRYKFLPQAQVFEALNKLRAAFLAAKNGSEVEEIINGLLTYDEKMKIGRRIIASQLLSAGLTYEQITKSCKLGKQTVHDIDRRMGRYPKCFELINEREEKVNNEYHERAYRETKNTLNWKKYIEYTGFKRKDVQR